MQYRDLGNTGIQLSTLGFGAMRLPKTEVAGQFQFDYEESARMIQRAYQGGVNYFDTAPYYCDKESEIIVGKAIKGFRDKIYLSTKNPVEDDSAANWRGRLEKSLTNLDTDYIDFYHMWGISWKEYTERIDVSGGPLQEALKAKSEGLIKHLSFSFHDKPENLFKIIDTGVFESMLVQYNFLDRSNEMGIAYAKEKGIGVIIMGPVGGGRLGQPSTAIQSILPNKTSSSAELALKFVLSNQHVTTALSGMSNMAMVEENLKVAARATHLSTQEIAQVNAAVKEKERLSELYCTACNYCMPCPHKVNIPHIFKLMNYHRLYGITDYARAEYAKLLTPDSKNGKAASACIDCGICEDKCPQKIEIRKQLKESAKVLG